MRTALAVRAQVLQVLDVALRVSLALVKLLHPGRVVRGVRPVHRLRRRASEQTVLLDRRTLGLVQHLQWHIAHLDLVTSRQQTELVHKLSCDCSTVTETETSRTSLAHKVVKLLHQKRIVYLACQLDMAEMPRAVGLESTGLASITPFHGAHSQIIETTRDGSRLQLSEDLDLGYFNRRQLSDLLRRQVEKLHTSD